MSYPRPSLQPRHARQTAPKTVLAVDCADGYEAVAGCAMTSVGNALSTNRRTLPMPFFRHHSWPCRSRSDSKDPRTISNSGVISGISTIPVEVLRPLIGGNFRRNCRDFAVTTSRRVNALPPAPMRFSEITHRIVGVRA